jgi:ribosomal 50S subunit-recycling heat shock protein
MATAKKRVPHGEYVPELAAALTPVAEALSQPGHVTISESSPKPTKSSNAGDRMEINALARDFASTMTKLMELECSIEVQIRAAVESEKNLEKVDRLKSRLRIVRR